MGFNSGFKGLREVSLYLHKKQHILWSVSQLNVAEELQHKKIERKWWLGAAPHRDANKDKERV